MKKILSILILVFALFVTLFLFLVVFNAQQEQEDQKTIPKSIPKNSDTPVVIETPLETPTQQNYENTSSSTPSKRRSGGGGSGGGSGGSSGGSTGGSGSITNTTTNTSAPPQTGTPLYAKNTVVGAEFSPAHVPLSSPAEIELFFNQSKMIGSHVTLIADWAELPTTQNIALIQQRTKSDGLAFHFQLSPTTLYGGRKNPSLPSNVAGGSFNDTTVREAFKEKALELAELRPNYLALGTEVNLLAQNESEFFSYVSLTKETYKAIKEKYPDQNVTISFQWDIMLLSQNPAHFALLHMFNQSLDVYSFTTYPSNYFSGGAQTIPHDYYTSIRSLLPTQRIAFSEVGWSSNVGGEDMQADYYSRLPSLMAGAHPEYITLALMHDVTVFNAELGDLNTVGIRNNDGSEKKSWSVVVNMTEIH